MSLSITPDALDTIATAPLWREAVVGASVAAMAAAAGLGTHYEVGAAPGLSMAAAVVTAAALWGAHRQLGRQASAPPTPRSKPAQVKSATAPTASTAVVDVPSAKVAPTKPELSSFVPRTAPPPLPQQAAVAQAPSPAIPALPPMPAIDPEAQFLQLQGLVRQLAADVDGPRARTADPDSGFARAGRVDGTPEAALTPAVPPPLAAASPLAQKLAQAVAAERFDVLLEPIQKLADARPRHFEISVRFRDSTGEALPVADASRIARATGLAASIDALKLPQVAKVVQRVQARGGVPADVLTEIAGMSLADHAFMEAFAAAFSAGPPGALVLSFAQADVRAFARVHWSALSALSDMGLRFALEDVSDLDMDFELLRARAFVFAKFDAGTFLDGLPCAGDLVPAADICAHLAGVGLEVIVTGIDTDTALGRIAGHGVPYGQGRLFGGARPVKSDILR